MSVDWPTTELDPVRRLRIMAAGLNAVMYADAHLDRPFADVWAVASDLEGELPHLVPTLRAFHLSPVSGPRRHAWAYGPLGHRARFEVVLQPGWCLMQSGCVIGGMAAVPEGSGTRFAVLGALRQSRPSSALRTLRPLGSSRGRRMIARARRRAEARFAPRPANGP
ncbi:hypothetical protein [Streptomyces sp. NPDC060027]|uniref:hypothetical protein n=1 Tax=Streptomyces sp. NPDC060027 TaxID=3347040 RepID=UPI0036D174D3